MANISSNVAHLQSVLEREDMASRVADMYESWKGARRGWENEQKELRNYLFATDTTTTTNSSLPWKNSTTTPKLTQIRDNLHANYMAALFPHDDWFKWRAESEEDSDRNKARAIEAYMKNKIRVSGFKQEVSKLLYDYIDYGNAFAEVIYETKAHTGPDGATYTKYIGPRLLRLSPFDVVFDITASDFKGAPKITKSYLSIGQLKKAIESTADFDWVPGLLDELRHRRHTAGNYQQNEVDKSVGLQMDGFGSYFQYLQSGMVEILEFEGDYYDVQEDELYENYKIIVVDRSIVAAKAPMESWFGQSNKEHVSWRLRPDNLMGMGPLHNLVGMQYRIDHLENLKADVFDQIAHPVIYQRGHVEDWEWGPGERIYGDEESDVKVLAPDTTALNADFQIQNIMNVMEEMAGAPRQAMGIRTPGEKTAFEVQALQNAAGRIFQNKIQYFEENFIEPLLNQMLEAARRNVNVAETVEIIDEDFGVQDFLNVTPEDLKARGKLVPVGARHFARQSQIAQNLLGLSNSAIYQDPNVNVHISGFKMAQVIEEMLDLGKYDLVQQNIRVTENQETQSLASEAQDQNAQQVAGRLADTEAPVGP